MYICKVKIIQKESSFYNTLFNNKRIPRYGEGAGNCPKSCLLVILTHLTRGIRVFNIFDYVKRKFKPKGKTNATCVVSSS